MALKQGRESFTKWTHVENGRVMVRRIHRIEIQALNGTLYTIRGDQLPDFIQTSAGEGHTDAHLAQILLSPKTIPQRKPYVAPPVNSWPTFRDVVNMGIGLLVIALLKFFFSVMSDGL